MSDEQMEQEIVKLGLTAPRITKEHIDKLTSELTFHTYVIPNTTTTVATAINKYGFVLAVEIMACASPENFNKELGIKYGTEKAKASAINKLWELEGYALKKELTKETI